MKEHEYMAYARLLIILSERNELPFLEILNVKSEADTSVFLKSKPMM